MVSVPRATLEELIVRDFARSVHELDTQALPGVLDVLTRQARTQAQTAAPATTQLAPRAPAIPSAPAPTPAPAGEPSAASTAPARQPQEEKAARRTESAAAAAVKEEPSTASAAQDRKPEAREDSAAATAFKDQVLADRARALQRGSTPAKDNSARPVDAPRADSTAQRPLYDVERAADAAQADGATPPPPPAPARGDPQRGGGAAAQVTDQTPGFLGRRGLPPGADVIQQSEDLTAELLGLRGPSSTNSAEAATQRVEPAPARWAAAAADVAGLPVALWAALDRVLPEGLRASSGALATSAGVG